MVKMWYYAGMLFLRARELPTTKGEKMLKRGFISRSASVVTLVGALALLSSISGVTAGTIDDSVGNAQQSPSSLVFSSASADGFSYSRWLENQGTVPASADSASTDESQADQGQAPITYGSFVLTETPLERIYGNVKDSWTQTFSNIITRAGDTSMLRGWAKDYVIGKDVDIQAGIDSWWDQRRADTTGIFVGMADVLTDNIFQAGEDYVGGLSFIRSLDWDYQTELGDRPWQLGVNALGSLREANDDVILWQLRGFTAKDTKGGANAGLVYRRAHEDTAMLGVNAFLDFQSHDLGDFWRWSVGGEVRTEWLDFYGNRYIAITDPMPNAEEPNKWDYSRDGVDFGVVFNVPNISWVKGNIEYYLWEGEFGDPDKKGFIYGVNVIPPMAENLRLELKLNDQDGGDLDVGGAISYRHEFGGVPSGTRTAGASSFDPRDYFFEPVRRRYDQEIGTSVGGGDVGSISAPGARMIFSSITDGVTLDVTVDINMPEYPFSRANPITIEVDEDGADGVTITAVGMDIAGIAGSGYDISLSDATKISFEEEGELVSLFTGHLYIGRDGASPERIATPDMAIHLIGTDLRVSHIPSVADTAITLYKGVISLAYEGTPTFEASVANDAQIHAGSVTYYACNGAEKKGNFIGVTSVLDCVLKADVTPDPTAGNVIAAVGLPKGDLVRFDVSKGVGAYNLELTSNPKNYFVVVQDDSDSSIFRISVVDVPESEDGVEYVIAWRLNDEFDGVDSGNITVQFTKAPSAENALRYAVAGQTYTETINIPVVGGVPGSNGYTFTLDPNADSGYTIGGGSGYTIVLNAAATHSSAGVVYVTVDIDDSQTPPQSGTFVLEVRVVPVLAIAAPASALEIFQTESESLLSLVSGGNDYNEATNERTFQIVEGNDDGNFSIDSNGVLEVGISAPTVLVTLKVEVAETVPSQNATADVEVSVKFKASDVALDTSVFPASLDPDVDLPLTISLLAAGGFGEYTYSIEGAPSYISLNANVLVVSSPGSDKEASFNVKVEDTSQTFPTGVSDTDSAQITFKFERPQAMVEIIGGEVVVSGSPEAGVNGTYNDGDTVPAFDPRPSTGEVIFFALSGADDDLDTSAVASLQNGDIQLTATYTPSSDLFSNGSGEWFFASASVIAQIAQDGGLGATFNGRPLQFSNTQDITDAINSPIMVAISAPGNSAVGKINSSVPFLYCARTEAFGANAYDCQIRQPGGDGSTTQNRSVSSVDSATVIPSSVRLPAAMQSRGSSPVGPWLGGVSGGLQDPVAVRGGADRVLLPSVQTPDADCEVTPTDCRYKTAIVAGLNFAIPLPVYVLEDDLANNGVGNVYAFFPYGGRFLFRDASNAVVQTFEAGFTLEYPDNCMVTLGSDDAADCGSSSSFAFASN